MVEHSINQHHNFIQGYYFKDKSICDKLIKHYNSQQKTPGVCNAGVDKSIKDSLDVTLTLSEAQFYEEFKDYFSYLQECLEIYKNKYHFCDKTVTEFAIDDGFNIQKYAPGGGYPAWHCEKADLKSSNRHLVWMTYLNDVKQGGETEFYYQKLKVKPEKGLTLIWTADWTFTHKGHTTIDEDKYIITGWYHYIK